MGAPHSTGIALGTKDVIDTIARHSFVGYESRRIRGIGRPHKIDRQEIIGVYAAVKRWMSLNHEERLSYEESKTLNIINDIKDIDGLEVKIIDNIIGHHLRHLRPVGWILILLPSLQIVLSLKTYKACLYKGLWSYLSL